MNVSEIFLPLSPLLLPWQGGTEGGQALKIKMVTPYWNPVRTQYLIGTFRSDYEYEIEYEYDFSILVFRLHIIATRTHFIP